jgi:hypothetical protein
MSSWMASSRVYGWFYRLCCMDGFVDSFIEGFIDGFVNDFMDGKSMASYGWLR